jgi:hypothetical protein
LGYIFPASNSISILSGLIVEPFRPDGAVPEGPRSHDAFGLERKGAFAIPSNVAEVVFGLITVLMFMARTSGGGRERLGFLLQDLVWEV